MLVAAHFTSLSDNLRLQFMWTAKSGLGRLLPYNERPRSATSGRMDVQTDKLKRNSKLNERPLPQFFAEIVFRATSV